MAVRGDVIIDWTLSPRIITIASPSVAISMQDLLDTLRFLEAQPDAMENASIVDASGKENLGGGVKVGLSVTLQNAKVCFEGRPGPEWVLCSLDGGNLVAVDTDDINIDPRHPTSFITVDRTSSASATLQEQDALQYASYGDVVSVNASSSNTGTDYPVGNKEFPVNNISDAVLIAHLKGFDTILLIGPHSLTSGDNLTGLKLRGQNPILTALTSEDLSITADCQIEDVTLTGILDGGTVIERSLINGLEYVSGIVYNCALTELPIVLGGNEQATFIDCSSNVSGLLTPIIDMNGSGQSLAIRKYSGGVRIINRTGNDPVSIDMDSGHVIIDATCTGDPITIRGSFKLTVEAGATTPDTEGRVMMESSAPLVASELLNTDVTLFTAADTVGEALFRSRFLAKSVYIDTESILNGDGSQSNPFNNVNDAKDFAEANHIKNIILAGSVILPSSIKNMNVYGVGLPEIEFNGFDVKGSRFNQVTLKGAYTSPIIAEECRLTDGFSLNGYFQDCELLGGVIATPATTVSLITCVSGIAGIGNNTLSMNSGVASSVSVRGFRGGLTIQNCDHINDAITVEVAEGSLTFDPSCTAGTMVPRGNCKFVNNAAGATVHDETVFNNTIAKATWEFVI